MAPEFDTSYPPMLSVRPFADAGGVDGPDNCAAAGPAAPDGPVRFGEGPACRVEGAAWTEALDELLGVGSALRADVVEEELDGMQEQTLDALYALLDRAGVSRDERLVIVLDRGGCLDVGEHPQRDQVLAQLRAHPGIAERLRAMAALALTERGMQDVTLAGRMLRGGGNGDERIFQATLKGGLSHFHLVRGQ